MGRAPYTFQVVYMTHVWLSFHNINNTVVVSSFFNPCVSDYTVSSVQDITRYLAYNRFPSNHRSVRCPRHTQHSGILQLFEQFRNHMTETMLIISQISSSCGFGHNLWSHTIHFAMSPQACQYSWAWPIWIGPCRRWRRVIDTGGGDSPQVVYDPWNGFPTTKSLGIGFYPLTNLYDGYIGVGLVVVRHCLDVDSKPRSCPTKSRLERVKWRVKLICWGG